MSTPFISSYVLERWNISTIYRQSSAIVNSPPWYYETIIWEWDKESRIRGKMIDTRDSGRTPTRALLNHAKYCAELIENGKLNEEDEL